MKRINYLISGFAALAFIFLFSQCAGKGNNQASSTTAQPTAGGVSAVKIAYVEIDTLLARYNFCIDLNKVMVKKSENVRLELNKRANALAKEKQEFQKKYENNAFLSKESAESQYARLAQKEQELQNLSNKLQEELMRENEKNSITFRDSINAFLKVYNKTHGYSLIISNNVLYADSTLNITKDVIEGLNERYNASKK